MRASNSARCPSASDNTLEQGALPALPSVRIRRISSKTLRLADEHQFAQRARFVPAIAARGTDGAREQPQGFVVANRLWLDPCSLGELTNQHGMSIVHLAVGCRVQAHESS